MQPHPDAEAAERVGKNGEARLALLAAPFGFGIADVEPIGARVLRDDEKLGHAGVDQVLGLAHDVAEGTARELAPKLWDDAEAADVVATFGDFQIGVVPRRQAHAFGRHKVEERIMRPGDRLVHFRDHGLVLLRPGDGEHVGIALEDAAGLDPEAAGDDHFAVLGKASPMAASDSSLALFKKPQVLTTTASAPS